MRRKQRPCLRRSAKEHECRSVCSALKKEAARLFRDSRRHSSQRWRDNAAFRHATVAGAARGGRIRCVVLCCDCGDELGHGRKKKRRACRACWSSPAGATHASAAIHACCDCFVSSSPVAWGADIKMKKTPNQPSEPTLAIRPFRAHPLRSPPSPRSRRARLTCNVGYET